MAQAIPKYCMTTFLLPSILVDELHIKMNKFWWGSGNDDAKGINWMRWKKLCVRKSAGGGGLGTFIYLISHSWVKMAWRLIKEPDALVCRILRTKYCPQGDFLTTWIGENLSFTWCIIHACQDLIRGIGRDCLPHKVNLFTKKVVDDKWCVFYGTQFEDTWHVFFNCRYALSSVGIKKGWEINLKL